MFQLDSSDLKVLKLGVGWEDGKMAGERKHETVEVKCWIVRLGKLFSRYLGKFVSKSMRL